MPSASDREPPVPGFLERLALAVAVGVLAAAFAFRGELETARAVVAEQGYAELGFTENLRVELAAATDAGLASARALGFWAGGLVLAGLLAVAWIPALRTPAGLARAFRGTLAPALAVAAAAAFVLAGLWRLALEREGRGEGWLAPSDLGPAAWALGAGAALVLVAAFLARGAGEHPGRWRAAHVRALLVGGAVLAGGGYWLNRGVWTPPKDTGVLERNLGVAAVAVAVWAVLLWRWGRGARLTRPCAVLALVAATWGFGPTALERGGPPAPALAVQKPLNVIVLALDTVRADQTSILGDRPKGRDTTENLRRLAERGLNFRRAITQAPWTIPAFASVLTGRYPHDHGALVLDSKLGPAQVTLAEVLREAGYETYGVVSHMFLQAYRGFAQGFDGYDESATNVPDVHRASSSGPVTDNALAFLAREHERPFFLFAHYFDPHYEYQDHAEWDFAEQYQGWFRDQLDFENLQKNARLLGEDDRQWLFDLYQEELFHTDRHIGRLLDYLEASGLAETTVVVVVADHGESLGEHGYYGHTINLDQEVLHVPFVIAPPKGHPIEPRVIDEVVETRMLFGTLLGLLDVTWTGGSAPVGSGGSGGSGGSDWSLDRHRRANLLRLVGRGDPAEKRAFSGVFLQSTDARFAKRFKQAALVQGDYKLVFDMTRGREDLFDLEADPGEHAPLDPAQSGAILLPMRKALYEWIHAMESGATSVRGAEPRPEQAEDLRELGYVGAGGEDREEERPLQEKQKR